MAKVKRTYNLSPEAVRTVKELAENKRIAPSQDAVVERAIHGFARRVRDAEHARQWRDLSCDSEFLAENEEILHHFEEDDRLGLDAGR